MVVSYLKAVLSLDNRKFKKGLDDSKKETAKFGKQIGRVGTAIGTAFAVKALADFVRGMDRLYAKTQNVTSGFQDIQDAFFEIAKAGQYGRGINIAFKRIADDIRAAGGEARKYTYLLEYSNQELADYIKLMQSDILARGYLDHTKTIEELNAALKITNQRAEDAAQGMIRLYSASPLMTGGAAFPGLFLPGKDADSGPDGMLAQMQNRIKVLEHLQKMSNNAHQIRVYATEIENLKNKIDELTTPITATAGLDVERFPIAKMQSVGISSVFQDPEVIDSTIDMTQRLTQSVEDLSAAYIRLGEIMQNLLAAAFQSFTRMVMDIVTGGDILSAFGTFLQDLGNMMAQYGAALIAFGIAENAFLAGDAYTKIAAGAVMLAAGLALGVIGGQINKTGGAGISGGTGSYSGGYAGGYGYGGGYDYNREIVLVARGEDLVATINRQNYIDGING